MPGISAADTEESKEKSMKFVMKYRKVLKRMKKALDELKGITYNN